MTVFTPIDWQDTTNYPSSKTVDPEQFPLSHSSMSMLQNMGAANAFDQAVPTDVVHTADQILDSDQPLTSDFSMSRSSAELLEQMSKETAFDNDAHDVHDAPEPVKDDAGVVPDVIESGFALSGSSTRLLQQTHDIFETDAHADEERAPFTEYEEIVDVYSFDTPVRRKSSGKNAQAQEHANFDFADAKPSNSELSAAQDYSSYSHINQPAAESKTELLDTECHRSENPLIIESTIQQMIDYPTQKARGACWLFFLFIVLFTTSCLMIWPSVLTTGVCIGCKLPVRSKSSVVWYHGPEDAEDV